MKGIPQGTTPQNQSLCPSGWELAPTTMTQTAGQGCCALVPWLLEGSRTAADREDMAS